MQFYSLFDTLIQFSNFGYLPVYFLRYALVINVMCDVNDDSRNAASCSVLVRPQEFGEQENADYEEALRRPAVSEVTVSLC
ncbi:hypothetical protein SRHO_G00063330 [Serrasalmus rhombeus]